MNNTTPTLTPLQCLKCQAPLPAEVDEVAWVCPICGQATLLDDSPPSGLVRIDIHYDSGLRSGQPGRPFWVTQGDVAVSRQSYRGNETRQAQEFWQKPRTFFVPAFACSLTDMVILGMQFLHKPIVMTEGQPAPFLPVKLSPVDARPMAEFIIMGMEAERKDMLKSVQIELKLTAPVLWILP